MNCSYHITKQVSFICIAPHKCQCQRKLCSECFQDHGTDVKQTIPIDNFGEIVIKKLKEFKFNSTIELSKEKMNLKSTLSQIEIMMKKILEDLIEQINQIDEMIEQENQYFINLTKENMNFAESSEADLEKLIQSFESNSLNQWYNQKKIQLIKLEELKKWLDQEVKVFNEKVRKEMNQFHLTGQSNVQQQIVQEETQRYKVNHQVKQQSHQDYQEKQLIESQLSLLKNEQQQEIQYVSEFNIKPFTYQIIKQNSIQQQESCCAVAFNENCSIVAATCNQLIKIYEFIQGKLKLIQVLKENKTIVTSLTFMKKLNQLISGNGGGSIMIWSINKNNQWICSQKLQEPNDRINCLIVNNNEDIIITSSSDYTIKFWIKKNGWICQQTITYHKQQVFQLSLNEQQNKVISCGYDHLILIIEYSEQNNIWIVIQSIKVDCCGYRICFINDKIFTFQPHQGNFMQVFELHSVSKQFTKTKHITLDQGGDDNNIFFPQQYIKQKQLIMSKHDNNINLIRKTKNDEFRVEQSVHFRDYCLFGQMSDDGEYLIIQDNSSKEIQVWKYTEK